MKKTTRQRAVRGTGGRKCPKSHAAESEAGRRRGKVQKSHATINSLDEEINNLLIRRDKQMSVYSRLRLQSEGQITK